MKVKSFLSAGLVSLLWITGCAATPAVDSPPEATAAQRSEFGYIAAQLEGQRYRHLRYGFEFDLPPGWREPALVERVRREEARQSSPQSKQCNPMAPLVYMIYPEAIAAEIDRTNEAPTASPVSAIILACTPVSPNSTLREAVVQENSKGDWRPTTLGGQEAYIQKNSDGVVTYAFISQGDLVSVITMSLTPQQRDAFIGSFRRLP